MVNPPETVGVKERVGRPRQEMVMAFFLPDPGALQDTLALIDALGERAPDEARARADCSRDKGNLLRFCHWRQVERAAEALGDRAVWGTVH